MADLVGETGRVVGVDHIPELVNASRENIRSDRPDLMDRVVMVAADGRLGYPDMAPYDCMYV